MKTIYFLCGPLLTVVIMTEERLGQKTPASISQTLMGEREHQEKQRGDRSGE